ncbi:hypothetical protein E1287_33090 [Actinomadura sp. KC06]|uniref:hypothetical protein n=1 Tax=Actinomadura sp. KC06 TaxID=2530369 RepID=UPI001043B44C|nr:hypothetical protein [Actinomadura sp. KC06]TDD28229.1 hypothetical protein E1287_33090 [Actinomadura sp. KC06]
MDELQMLRKHHDARPGPSREAVVEARARLDEKARTRERLPRAWRRRYVLGAATVGIAAVVTVPLSTIGTGEPGSDHAYAAERMPDGRIKVTMDDLTGPPGAIQHRLNGVERKLAALGINADIELLPFGMRCSVFPRGAADRETNSRTSAVDDGWLLPDRDKRAVFFVHPDRIKPGNTLLWTLSVHSGNGSTAVATNSYQVRGPAEPCTPVPLRGS